MYVHVHMYMGVNMYIYTVHAINIELQYTQPKLPRPGPAHFRGGGGDEGALLVEGEAGEVVVVGRAHDLAARLLRHLCAEQVLWQRQRGERGGGDME